MNNQFSGRSSAYLLVSHGSRDPQHQIAVKKLAASVRQQLEASTVINKYRDRQDSNLVLVNKPETPIVTIAQLESTAVPLHQNIIQLGLKLTKSGIKSLRILPLFLLPGIHVKEDIPAAVNLATEILEDTIAIELLPYLGSSFSLTNLIAAQFNKLNAPARILISHGSSRQGGNRPCEEIASKLGVDLAYCWVSPSLRATITKIATQETKKIAIVPYFLFTGKILKSIAAEIAILQQEFPQTRFLLGEPLAETPELASEIIKIIK